MDAAHARVAALEAEKQALVQRVLRGEGELRDAQELAADLADRVRDLEAALATERAAREAALRDRDRHRADVVAQGLLLREIPALAARLAELEAAQAVTSATDADEQAARDAVERAMAAERALRQSIEAAFVEESLVRTELEGALAASHSTRVEIDRALALEKKQRSSVEAALAASGELLRAAEERYAKLIEARAVPADAPAPPVAPLTPIRDLRAREAVLREELALLGERCEALLDALRFAARALAALSPGPAGVARALLGIPPSRDVEGKVAAAALSALGATIRAEEGQVLVDFAGAPAGGEAIDPFEVLVASWAAAAHLGAVVQRAPTRVGDPARLHRFALPR